MVDTGRAEVLISATTSVVDPLHVRLSNKSFSPDAATVIADRLRTFKNVQVADISDIIAGRPEEEANRTLQIISEGFDGSNLVEVNVSDNALGCRGINACRNLFIGKKIERIYVCNDGLASESAVLLSELLLEGGCPPIKLFHYFNNMSGDDGAIAVSGIVKACVNLTDFRFSGVRSQKKGCAAIADALGSLTTLTRLDLSDNMFQGDAGTVLADVLQKQSGLTYLNLRDGGLSQSGIINVFKKLKESPCAPLLKFLDVSGNDVDAEAAEALADLLPSLVSLEDLAMDDNEIGTEGITSIAKVLRRMGKASHLKTLSACFNEITAAGAYSLSLAVSKIPSFVTLRLDGNAICERGVTEIKGLLGRAGKVLEEMEDNNEDEDDDLDDVLEEEEEGEGGADEEGDKEADELADALEKSKI